MKMVVKDLLRLLLKFSNLEVLLSLPHEIKLATPIGREIVTEGVS
jgi:hypothetical protein